MRKLSMTLAAAILALGLLAAGCGDSDENDTGVSGNPSDSTERSSTGGDAANDGASAVSGEEFAKRANAICEASRQEIQAGMKTAIEENAGKAPTAGESVNVIVPVLVSGVQTQVDGIRALDVPSDEEDRINAMLAAFEAWIAKAKSDPEAVVGSSDIYNDAREMASNQGLTVCAKGPLDP